MVNLAIESPYSVLLCPVCLWVHNLNKALARLDVGFWTKFSCALTVNQNQALVPFLPTLPIFQNKSHKNLRVSIDIEITHPQPSLERIFFSCVQLCIKRVRNINNQIIYEKLLEVLNRDRISTPIINLILSQIERWINFMILDLIGFPAQILLIAQFVVFVVFRDQLVVESVYFLLMVENHVCHSIQVYVCERDQRDIYFFLCRKFLVFCQMFLCLDQTVFCFAFENSLTVDFEVRGKDSVFLREFCQENIWHAVTIKI